MSDNPVLLTFIVEGKNDDEKNCIQVVGRMYISSRMWMRQTAKHQRTKDQIILVFEVDESTQQ